MDTRKLFHLSAKYRKFPAKKKKKNIRRRYTAIIIH